MTNSCSVQPFDRVRPVSHVLVAGERVSLDTRVWIAYSPEKDKHQLSKGKTRSQSDYFSHTAKKLKISHTKNLSTGRLAEVNELKCGEAAV